MNRLNEDALLNLPNFVKDNRIEIPLTEAKLTTINWMNNYYDFRKLNFKTYLNNVNQQETLQDLKDYVMHSALKGFDIKRKTGRY